MLSDAVDAFVDSGGVGKPCAIGLETGVLTMDGTTLGEATVGDVKGDCKASCESLK